MICPPILVARAMAKLRPPKRDPFLIDHHPGVVVHCTGGVRPTDLAHALERWRVCQTSHQAPPKWVERTDPDTGRTRRVNIGGNGWADIGYSFGVTPDGEVLEGRGWGVRGAHAKGRNRWLGIVVLGKGTDITVGEQQAIEWLVEEHLNRGGDLQVRPHNAFSTKRCPGPAVTRWVERRWPPVIPEMS